MTESAEEEAIQATSATFTSAELSAITGTGVAGISGLTTLGSPPPPPAAFSSFEPDTDFVHLHLHTPFSFLDGGSAIEALVQRAAMLGMTALAMTDHNGLYAAVKFAEACRAFGIKPILGAEVTLGDNSHLTLLAESRAGYGNLCRLITAAHAAGGRLTPRLPWSTVLGGDSGDCPGRLDLTGLICLTGCRNGLVAKLLRSHLFSEATDTVRELKNAFGPGNVYVEMQDDWTPGSRNICRLLALLAYHESLPVVATNNVHYATPTDAISHEVLRAIGTGTMLSEVHEARPLNAERYLKTAMEMHEMFAWHPLACDNTLRIAERCTAEEVLPNAEEITPKWKGGSGGGEEPALLRTLSYQGARERYRISGTKLSAVKARLDHELDVICRLGYADYMLLCHDVVHWSRMSGIRCSGRGSAADSAVAYTLYLTDVDVLKRDLPFARFLMEGKVPDVDVDFPSDRRDEVFTYIQRTYGADRTARCCTFHLFLARSAVRDIGKVLALPPTTLDFVTDRLHHFLRADSLDAAFEKYAELREHAHLRERFQHLFSLCARIAGFPRHLGSHSSGVVISRVPLAQIAPVEAAAGGVLPIWTLDKDDAETAGAVKFDVLGLRMLSAVADAERDIARRSPSFSYDHMPLDDKETYAMIQSGKAIGAFQLESAAQLALASYLLPDEFEHIVASVALIRPGPVRGNAVQRYVAGRHGWTAFAYLHPCLEPILAKSYGCIIFQEQVDLVCAALMGTSHEEAERFRKRLARHTKLGTLDKARAEFEDQVQRCRPEMSESARAAIWTEIEGWGGYGFIEGHAAAFGLTAYKTAYLSTHHAAEFFSGELNQQPMGFWPPNTLAAEARRRGVRVLPVDINESGTLCEARPDDAGSAMRLGLNLVTNLRDEDVAAIVAQRESGGRFRSLLDFVSRIPPLHRDRIENLILCGAFDDVEERRRRGLLFALGETLDAALWLRRSRGETRKANAELPYEAVASFGPTPCADGVEEFSVWDQFLWTWRLTGVAAECHVFSYLRNELNRRRIVTCYDAQQLPAGTRVVVAGLNIRPHRPPTKSGNPVLFTSLEDETEVLHLTCVGAAIDSCTATLLMAQAVIVEGIVERRGLGASLLVDRVKSLHPERYLSAMADVRPVPITNVRVPGGSAGEPRRPVHGSHAKRSV